MPPSEFYTFKNINYFTTIEIPKASQNKNADVYTSINASSVIMFNIRQAELHNYL